MRPTGREEIRGEPRGDQAAGQPAQQASEASGAEAAALAPAPADDPLALVDTIASAIDAVSDETGWAGLGAVGRTITKLKPDFDSRLYGHRKFSDLVRSLPERFELDERTTGTGKSLFVRLAPRPDAKAGAKARAGKAPRKRKSAAKAAG